MLWLAATLRMSARVSEASARTKESAPGTAEKNAVSRSQPATRIRNSRTARMQAAIVTARPTRLSGQASAP